MSLNAPKKIQSKMNVFIYLYKKRHFFISFIYLSDLLTRGKKKKEKEKHHPRSVLTRTDIGDHSHQL